ncbi:putative basic amino acid antiporter YfcC [Pseudoduganella danionis]|uniref:Basic amino acid antiporter YfcC n=1 Tax=Pseudoduganella danionis TaxID=1890295 RepID=A0ABW9SUQ4_9BURK|nr:putative basic amino acid antiporter YfcC [Pseudoduganella danionis]MTW34888.1 putative basic amino acid antiporter YfcC [Pseudoduganella danionis]
MSSPASRFKVPNTLIILLFIALFVALLVPWVPAGYFEKGVAISLDSYRVAEHNIHIAWFASGKEVGLFNAPFEGMTSGSRTGSAIGVIAFILLVGGAFGVINASGAVDRGLLRLIAITGDHPRLLLGSLFAAFAAGGAVFGMGEETIAFLALLLPLIRRMGYPPEVGVMMTYVASQIGFGTSWMNPFGVALAQGIANVPLLSGAPLRIVMFVIFVSTGIAFTLWYAERHRKPQPLPDHAAATDNSAPVDAHASASTGAEAGQPAALASASMTAADRLILAGIVATIIWIVWGVVAAGYFIPEIATQFVTLCCYTALIAICAKRLTADGAAEAFINGAQQLMPAVLVISMAKGIEYLLGGSNPHAPSVLNTFLHSMGTMLETWPPILAAQGMLAVQTAFTFVIHSGSAQAAINMPLMAGLSDLVGVTRQTAVLAYQLGNAMANMSVPTGAILMATLGVAGVPWTRWFGIIWRFQLLILLMSMGMVAFAVLYGYN